MTESLLLSFDFYFLTKSKINGIIHLDQEKLIEKSTMLCFERTDEFMREVETKVQFTTMDDVEEFVKAAGRCDFDIDITYEHAYIDAKSFLGILSLGLSRKLTVKYFGQNDEFENTLKNYTVA